ncbi:phosphotransferase family protein [Krasilnikoviella flava]|uniref:Ser/Thr protein kinase RdoA involved in Cpx stress response, MazF antagonist n=1 Tax=Krasilnikoviella flava TaxID=526729 RepID=A0A1T5J8Y0_9MICO|nr:phosphotransferase [Krasilnikoviella flava]SKC48007.1 Ser/Thr protein kinase RdoA involved in Cpx stress response, MazF antagonist [Krasilnikoviella flava]
MPTTVPAAVPSAPAEHRAWLDLLTGDAADGVLSAALAADDAVLESWSVRQVHARPGAEVTAAYEVVARRGAGDAAVRAPEHLFATSAPASAFRRARGVGGPGDRSGALGPGIVRLDDGERVVHVWRHPHDPALPGLAAGSTPSRVEERLRTAGADAPLLSLETVTYRPLRRAVLRARTGAGAVYVKVVRPARVDDLVRRHALFAGRPRSVAAPRVLSWSADGVVVLEEVPGASVAALVARTPAEDQPTCVDPAEILRVTTGLPRAGLALPRRPAWADRLRHYLDALAAVHGVDDARLEALGGAVADVVAAGDPGPLVVTHGDLHAANLLLDPATDDGRARPRIGAVLDVDTLGPGHLVDDLACSVAHLAVLPVLDPRGYAGVDGLVERCLAEFGRVAEPALLRARAAAVVASLAAGAEDAAGAEGFLVVAERLAAAATEV